MEQHLHNDPDTKETVVPAASPARDATATETVSFWGEFLRFGVLALIIVIPIRLFIAQPFLVQGASMEDTFTTDEYLIVEKVSYLFEEPARGDVIVFKYPNDPAKRFIKRIIAIPGDTIHIANGTVSIQNDEVQNGVILSEPYAEPTTTATPLTLTLKDDEYFVMGDNRPHSSDSRLWGTVPSENIVGKAFLRLFPFNKVDFLPGIYDLNGELVSNE